MRGKIPRNIFLFFAPLTMPTQSRKRRRRRRRVSLISSTAFYSYFKRQQLWYRWNTQVKMYEHSK